MMEDDKDKLKNEKNASETPEESSPRQDSSEEEEQEILFPKENEPQSEKKTPSSTSRFRWMNLVVLAVLLVGFYLIGFMTNAEQLRDASQTMKEIISFSKERFQPIKEKVETYIENQIGPAESNGSAKQEGSGTKMKGMPPSQTETGSKKKKVKYWRAPMNPDYKRDKPGKGPMGMDLVPVYEDETTEPGIIKINSTVIQNIGVKTAKVKERVLTHEIRTTGTLTYDERKVHHIHTKFGGWIEKLYVDFTGQEVAKDDMLMEIYSPELVSTQEEFLLALKYKKSLEDSAIPEIRRGAETLLQTTRRRLKLFDVVDHQIEELSDTQTIKKTMHIHSPVRGFVVHKNAQEGMFVEPGKSLYTIADLSNIWVLADIYEYELAWVKLGQKAEMSLSYFPGKKFKGTVTFINPFLDPKTRTIKVRMEFQNPQWKLMPDMYADVFLKSSIAKKGVAVPEQAVIRSGENDLVIVQTSPGQFESRPVVLGVEAEGHYQVLEGLRSGETVVTSSNFLIDSESRLTEALDKLTPDPSEKKSKDPKKQPGKLELQLDEKNTAPQK